eukprot:4637830-Amphidinium_carterae.1
MKYVDSQDAKSEPWDCCDFQVSSSTAPGRRLLIPVMGTAGGACELSNPPIATAGSRCSMWLILTAKHSCGYSPSL